MRLVSVLKRNDCLRVPVQVSVQAVFFMVPYEAFETLRDLKAKRNECIDLPCLISSKIESPINIWHVYRCLDHHVLFFQTVKSQSLGIQS